MIRNSSYTNFRALKSLKAANLELSVYLEALCHFTLFTSSCPYQTKILSVCPKTLYWPQKPLSVCTEVEHLTVVRSSPLTTSLSSQYRRYLDTKIPYLCLSRNCGTHKKLTWGLWDQMLTMYAQLLSFTTSFSSNTLVFRLVIFHNHLQCIPNETLG